MKSPVHIYCGVAVQRGNRPLLPHSMSLVQHLCQRLSRLQVHSVDAKSTSKKNNMNPSGIEPACSVEIPVHVVNTNHLSVSV